MRDRPRWRHRSVVSAFGPLIAVVAVIAAACGGGESSPPPPPPTITAPENAAPAIVRVELLVTEGAKATVRYWGTGTFVGPGVVLTSARLLDPAGGWDTIGIATIGRQGEPASLAYQADVVAIDPSLDVALLRVAADRDGKDIDPRSLRVATLAVAGNDARTPTPRTATVAGYTAQTSGRAAATRVEFSRGLTGDSEWVESDTLLSPGFGGAAVLDDRGQIVGVVALPEPGDDRLYVRRIAEARPLIDAAVGGKTLLRSGKERLPPPDRTASDKPADLAISSVTFYRDTTSAGEPAGAQTRFPSGTRRIVYSFDYRGMRPGAKWVDEWSVNGRVDPQLSPARPPWDRSTNGELVSSISDPKGLPDGVYRLRIVVNGLEMAAGAATVGPAASAPRFKRPVIAPDKGKQGEPVGQAEKLEKAATLFGFFDFEGMDATATWGYVWYHDGNVVARRDGLRWRGETAGSDWWVALYQPDGAPLAAGTYTLSLLLERQPVATATVVVNRSS